MGEQQEDHLHAVMVQVYQQWELELLVDMGEVHLDNVSGALYFDEVAQIFDIRAVVLVLFRVPAVQHHDLIFNFCLIF